MNHDASRPSEGLTQTLPELPAEPDRLLAPLLDVLVRLGAQLEIGDGRGQRAWCSAPTFPSPQAGPDEVGTPRAAGSDAERYGLARGAELQAGDQRLLAGGQGCGVTEQVLEVDGQRRSFRLWRYRLDGPAGAEPQVLRIWLDEQAQREQAQRLQDALAQIEQQQGAFDRLEQRLQDQQDRPLPLFRAESFEEHLRREMALSLREHREFALVLMQLEDFDSLRRRHGPEGVERAMGMVVHLLRANTRSMDMICRLAEDRVAILLSGVGLAVAFGRAEQFRKQCVRHLVVHEGVSMQVALSGGVSSFPHSAQTLAELSLAAEQAVARALQQGGQRICPATIDMPAWADTQPSAG